MTEKPSYIDGRFIIPDEWLEENGYEIVLRKISTLGDFKLVE